MIIRSGGDLGESNPGRFIFWKSNKNDYICIGFGRGFFKDEKLMKIKEIRTDLYTQTEYAKLLGISQARVNQMMKEGKLKLVKVNGTVLIKV